MGSPDVRAIVGRPTALAEDSASDSEHPSQHPNKGLLRVLTCGNVGDGKSTLIGRLLDNGNTLFDDQLAALDADSKKVAAQGGKRSITTDKRRFLVANTPGDEQYTLNTVTGADTADVAIVLVDARKGLVTQTRRHCYLVSLLGIRHVVLAVNKMDLVQYSSETFSAIESAYRGFADQLGVEQRVCIPMSALHGDNVVSSSDRMPWYRGPTLMRHLATVEVHAQNENAPFRLPVRSVNRPDSEFRGFAGTVVSGSIRPGDRIRVQPSGRESRVERIVSYDGELASADAGCAITVTLTDQIDVSPGDVISAADAPAEVADQFDVTITWMNEQPMLPGRTYWLKIGANTVPATISRLKHKVNINTLEHTAARKLELNEIGECTIALDRSIAFDAYRNNRRTGGFVLIDPLSSNTVGAGVLNFALRRSQNIHWQAVDIGKRSRAAHKRQRPCVLWFTGLSAAGKSTIANIVERMLYASGFHTYLLDGDNVRHGLNKDLGFTSEDRVENIRRVAEVAKLMVDAGLIVLVAFISPFRSERRMARQLVEENEFLEVFVDAPLEVAEKRDPKGLYRKARRGELKNFTGIDSPYEPPEHAEICIDTTKATAETAADLVVSTLQRRGMLGGGT